MDLKTRIKQGPACLLVALMLCALIATGCRTTGSSKALITTDDESEVDRRVRAHAQYSSAVVHDLNDKPQEALDAYFQAAILDPGNEQLVMNVSRRLILAREPERALEILKLSAMRPDASGEIYARLGLVYTQLGRPTEAAQSNSVAIRKSPTQLDPYKNFYNDLMLAGKPDEALKVLNQAADQKDVSPEFLVGIAELYALFLNQHPTRRNLVEPAALAVLDRADSMSPPGDMLRLRIGDMYQAMGEPLKATRYFETALPGVQEVPFLRDAIRDKLAEIYLKAGSNQLAVVHLEAITRDDPSNAKAYYLLGIIAVDERNWDVASENLEKAVMFNPGFERAYYDLANAQIATDRPGKALVTLNEARKKFQQNFLMEYLFASAFIEEKAYAQAIGHLNTAEVIAKASDTNRLNETFYFQCGVAYERNKDFNEAARYFKMAIERDPDFAAALNYLGYMWADRGENLAEAQELIERALKLEPDNEAYLDSLGWVRFKQGDYEAAIKHIQHAIDLSPEPDAELFHHLGDVYLAIHQPDKARDAWQKALTIEPDEDVRRKLDALKSR